MFSLSAFTAQSAVCVGLLSITISQQPWILTHLGTKYDDGAFNGNFSILYFQLYPAECHKWVYRKNIFCSLRSHSTLKMAALWCSPYLKYRGIFSTTRQRSVCINADSALSWVFLLKTFRYPILLLLVMNTE